MQNTENLQLCCIIMQILILLQHNFTYVLHYTQNITVRL